MQLMYMSAWEVSPPRCLKTVIFTHCKNGTCQLCGFTHLFYANILSSCYKFLNTELFTGLLAPSKAQPSSWRTTTCHLPTNDYTMYSQQSSSPRTSHSSATKVHVMAQLQQTHLTVCVLTP